MISFIYFDIGGVLINDLGSSAKWLDLKKYIGVKKEFDKEFDELFYKYQHKELCLNRNVDSLIPIFTEKFGMKFPDNYSFLVDIVGRFEKNNSIWPLVNKLNGKVKLGLLTNIFPKMLDLCFEKDLIPSVNWNVIIDSSVVGFQKPDVGIYSLAEEKSGVKKDEILYIDDAKKNIDAANKFGWKTILYDRNNPEESNVIIYNTCSQLL